MLVTSATYLGGTTLIAAISVAMGIRDLPSSMSAWASGIYIACAGVAVVMWVIGNLFVLPWRPSVAIGSFAAEGLPGLSAVSWSPALASSPSTSG